MSDKNKLCVNNMRVLACQLIEQANSGHPGIALGASPVLFSLYANHLNVSNQTPNHYLRDRFVLSAGHGSAMLYSALHMFGFPISREDLTQFRQIGALCAGHPERDTKVGIEATTGPLGQGVANAVGMAIAEKHLASLFNKPDAVLVNNYTYALVGDGCLMEGVANEALSLAGTLNLNKLIVLYDFNKITIDGNIDVTFKQSTRKVMEGYGFEVLEVKNGNDLEEINQAILKAKTSNKPSFIMVNSIIGFGSVLAGTEKAHGAPLGATNMAELQNTLNMHTQPFEVLQEVKTHMQQYVNRYVAVEKEWHQREEHYKAKYPKEWQQFQTLQSMNFSTIEKVLEEIQNEKPSISTRELGGMVLAKLGEHYPNIIGGAADLTSSTKTIIKNSGKFSHENPSGRNIMFGIREFGMAAVSNGIAMYGGFVPFASTFFVFSDYCKAAIRLSALMHLKMMYIFTHDSIGVGEDGPTHQSVEQLTTFRAMPNITVYRPANLAETKAGYMLACTQNQPTMLVLTRQNLTQFHSNVSDALKGAYIASKEQGELQGILIATGSEVQLALAAQKTLQQKGISVRVVSMPSQELFLKQSKAYQEKVLPTTCTARVAVEAGSTLSWHRFVGTSEAVVGLDEFGLSGKYEQIFEHYGITEKNIVHKLLKQLNK